MLAASGVVAAVYREALTFAAPYESAPLADGEMVHSDLSVSNVLLGDGQVAGVIDVDAAGRGCAVYDVLAPALADVLWSPTGGPIDSLHEFALDAYGPGPVAIAAAAHVVWKLGWLLDALPEDVDMMAEKCRSWLGAIRMLL